MEQNLPSRAHRASDAPMEWETSHELVPYEDALARMKQRVSDIQQGKGDELVWLLEHPPLYTAGTSAQAGDLLIRSSPVRGEVGRGARLDSAVPSPHPNPPPEGERISSFPVYETGRGGQYTYHGPGQRVAYVLRDLKSRDEQDLRVYVKRLEDWIIRTLAAFDIEGFTREGRIGVWASVPRVAREREPLAAGVSGAAAKGGQAPLQSEAKIAALGVRVQKWVTSHGIALNVHPDLSHYAGIVPCGIREYGVTSLHALGKDVSLAEVDAVLKRTFGEVFGSAATR